jgi:hypothetical protein
MIQVIRLQRRDLGALKAGREIEIALNGHSVLLQAEREHRHPKKKPCKYCRKPYPIGSGLAAHERRAHGPKKGKPRG